MNAGHVYETVNAWNLAENGPTIAGGGQQRVPTVTHHCPRVGEQRNEIRNAHDVFRTKIKAHNKYYNLRLSLDSM